MKKTTVAACSFLIAVLCTGLFTQCKKSNDNTAKSKLLMSGVWKYKEGVYQDGTGVTPIPAGILQPYDLDNLVTFKTDTTLILDEGATKHYSTDPQTTTYKYTFNTSTNTLNFPTPIFTVISGDVKVLDISSTQLKLSKDVPVSGTTSLTVIITLVH